MLKFQQKDGEDLCRQRLRSFQGLLREKAARTHLKHSFRVHEEFLRTNPKIFHSSMGETRKNLFKNQQKPPKTKKISKFLLKNSFSNSSHPSNHEKQTFSQISHGKIKFTQSRSLKAKKQRKSLKSQLIIPK